MLCRNATESGYSQYLEGEVSITEPDSVALSKKRPRKAINVRVGNRVSIQCVLLVLCSL